MRTRQLFQVLTVLCVLAVLLYLPAGLAFAEEHEEVSAAERRERAELRERREIREREERRERREHREHGEGRDHDEEWEIEEEEECWEEEPFGEEPWEEDILEHLEDVEEAAVDAFTDDVEVFLQEEIPEALEWLQKLEKAAESALGEAEAELELFEFMLDAAMGARELAQMKQHDKDIFPIVKKEHQLELRTMMLAEKFHKTENEEERDKIREQLARTLDEAFDVSQRMREYEAQTIEKELQEVRRLLEKRLERRDIIIERRLHEMLHGTDPFAW